jgi:signal transduction histidine kinase
MTEGGGAAIERRVLILAPVGRDAELAQVVLLGAKIQAHIYPDAREMCRAASCGAGALLVAEEAITARNLPELLSVLADQPPWADLPVLVLTRQGANSATAVEALASLGNVTLLERPVRVAALVSAVRVALRGRERQYQIRAHLEQREQTEQSLREADRRKDEFLAMLAHELRNPLAPISNSLHVLRLVGGTDPTLAGVRAMMERQVNHLVRLVDGLVEVSRLTRGRIELRKERVELGALLGSAVEASKPMLDAAGQEVVLALAPEPLYLDADPVRLVQVFANLLDNAAKYSERAGRISVEARREDEGAVVTVRDSGIGIPEDMLARIFEAFTQVGDDERRSQGGLGIGLTLARILVQKHGGSLTAFSEGRGRGSEFTVRLPLAAEGSAAASAGGPALGEGAAAVSVLVVDDNRDAADSLGILLRRLGAEARVFHDGASALRALETFRPALALLDIGMPGMDGFEVARRIRDMPGLSDLKLVALTGWDHEGVRARARTAGFDEHLVKPMSADDLQALMASVEGAGG